MNEEVSPLARRVASPGARYALRTLYYLAVLIGLVVLYGPGDLSTSGFIYQAF